MSDATSKAIGEGAMREEVAIDEALDDAAREHRYAQAALNRKRIDIPEGKTLRYEHVIDESERFMCDKVWIDRLTGKEVLRYDAADPANTNSYYGARPDEEAFVRKGLDIYALIDAKDAKSMPQFPVHYDNLGDDAYEDDYDPGEECGRWSNGRLSKSCSKAGSEECDFECRETGRGV